MQPSPEPQRHLFSAVPAAVRINFWNAYWGSPRCTGRRLRLGVRAGRCRPIDWMGFWLSWKHSRCTWRSLPVSWNLRRGEHLRPAITTLVEVILLSLWPIPWILMACAVGWLRTACHVEWRIVIKLWSAWKWLLWRRITIPMWQMILKGMFPKWTVFACGSSWAIIRWLWIVFTALLHAKFDTCWSHIRCLRWRSVRWHGLWIMIVVNYKVVRCDIE